MMINALIFTVLTGLAFALISMIISRIARDRISFFQFYTLSNLAAAAAAWILLPKWELLSGADWCRILLITGAAGMVNTASQATFVCSLKWGHNGLSTVIRNSGSVISMFFALIFLHETVSAVNLTGVVLILLSLAVTAVFGKKDSFSADLKKWIPAVTGSMLLSGTYQILLTGTVLLSEHDRKAGILIPCLLCSGAFWNLLASLIERGVRGKELKFYHFSRQEWKVLFCWAGAALLQYYLLFIALSLMRKAGMASLTWPMLIGINITAFSIFCRFKWQEKYPPATVIGMIGCILGLIMIIWGRK